MLEIFRDPLWQFAGALLTLIAIFVSILLYLRQRKRKSLSYTIVSCAPLLSVGEEIKNGLQILYNNKPIQQAHLVLIRIFNAGNTPVTTEDFEHSITLRFGERAGILTSEIVETAPPNLPASIRIEGRKLVLLPTLLNAGDSVELKALVENFDGLTIDGRIIGVKEISQVSIGMQSLKRTVRTVVLGTILGIITSLIIRVVLQLLES